MLTTEISKKINDFVYIKPRTVDEIAKHIQKNWRTANSYVDRIAEEQGTLSVRIFREGTRGALKIVHWNNIEKIHSTALQEKLFRKIEAGRKKEDFSPSEIFQYIDEKKKNLRIISDEEYWSKKNFDDFANFLRSAQKQIFFFSGNLTLINHSYKDEIILDVIEELAKRRVSIKILTRVELAGLENINKVLAINERLGREAIEIRHCYHPLRATIVDNRSFRLKEIFDPNDYSKNELKEVICVLYEAFDKEWTEWLQKIFWNMFSTSIPAEARIKNLEIIYKH